jgi:dTDP-4-amino-4,6-dideoxygalactose transaminase
MEIQGAVGLSQLTDLDSFIERRRFIASKVKEALKGSPLSIIEGDASDTLHARQHSRMLLSILDSRGKSTKDKTRAAFEAMGIETRPPLTGNFLAQPAAKRVIDSRFNARNFKNAQYLTDNSFLIGCHHEYTELQIEYLIESIHKLAQMG